MYEYQCLKKIFILQGIRNIQFVGGRTFTADGLNMLRTVLFTSANGDRLDVPNIGIVITDGQSNINPKQTLPEAVNCRLNGIHLMVVAIGNITT